MIKQIAMWSGPRNISTAMMRSFGNRPDTFVSDEPFYGFYLANTQIDHPGRNEVLQVMETDWDSIVQTITGSPPNDKTIWYQKHMAQHILPGVDLTWTKNIINCFLIRDPKEVIISYHKKFAVHRAELLGYPQQVTLYYLIAKNAQNKPVIVDAKDILMNPKHMLKKLCLALNIQFTEEMLFWLPGLRETDGVWAKYWYGNVINSTGFKPYQPCNEDLPLELEKIYNECLVHYNFLYELRLQ